MQPILALGEDIVNKIAAAEIIHRPSNAIKELLENSLDAGATSIKITIKEGGLKSIQIADNGHGINRTDLPLLCRRYATSKLREYKDLESIATYGFRGEALASISYCSLVDVVTKTRADSCGWKAQYADGELRGDPKPAAANDGTIITADDLFFNMPLRKKAFRSPSEEYNRILDVVTKYAVHNPHCAWSCKKATALPDLSTSVGTTRGNISLLYTPALAKELIEIDAAMEHGHIKGWISNANARRAGWLLFINNRLVESTKIRKAIEQLYTAFLPKGVAPWVYLSLALDPAQVDVNVHPTKSEVHFLHEDEIIEGLVSTLHTALLGANTARTFAVQSTLVERRDDERAPAKKAAPNYKIRSDLSTQTLDAMVERPAKRQRIESECEFTSVQDLRHAVLKSVNNDINELLHKHTFVGIVDEHKCLGMVQHGTKLYLLDYAVMGDEHFYQLGLQQFGAMDRLELDPPPNLLEMVEFALQDEGVEGASRAICDVLLDKRDMIDEYFSIGITSDTVESVPMLLRGYVPNLDRLPHFLLCLATQVDWGSEEECFRTVLRELAFFYSPREPAGERWQWQLEHVLFPSFRETQWPAMSVTQVANLPDLFRIFERC